ncbi:MAG: 4-alpha-glucanotransferase, partial [Chromatocurvus sp.]
MPPEQTQGESGTDSPAMSTPLAERASGLLLHITSLPSPWGVGDLGACAHELVLRLQRAGQRYWQVLPLNPVDAIAEDSPYFSSSSMAGNPLLVDLAGLVDAGLLSSDEVTAPAAGDTGFADYALARALKYPLLERAQQRFGERGESPAFRDFCTREAYWLDDHALFCALKSAYPEVWSDWPAGLRDRDPAVLAAARLDLGPAIAREKRWQFFFFRQWESLRAHAADHGVLLLGDTPIYVSFDSVDVWAHPALFQLDEQRRPLAVSGVPPDYFSATGQLWNNPLYDWEALRASGYAWWRERMAALLRRFDVVRIDHFRGLAQYWSVPATADSAIGGQWCDVPSHDFFDTLIRDLGTFPVVAEDLGTITPDVTALRDHYGFPGMVVLQFAFGEDNPHNPYLPENHPENAIAYLGTHDNDTVLGWLEEEADAATRERFCRYIDCSGEGRALVPQFVALLLSSRARVAIVTAQDLLALPGTARMNNPGRPGNNWRWQLTRSQWQSLTLASLGDLARETDRLVGSGP